MVLRGWLGIGAGGIAIASVVAACGGGADDPEPFGVGERDPGSKQDGSASPPDGGGGADVEVASPEAAAFCEGTLGRVADAYEACCMGADRESTQYKQQHDFSRGFVPACTFSIAKSLITGRLTHDPTQAAACLSAFETAYSPASCATLLQAVDPTPTSACQTMFAGTVSNGGACAGAHECVSGLTCVGHSSSADGVCMTPPALGEACGTAPGASLVFDFLFGDHPKCADGARCDNHKCVAAKTSGEPCTFEDECSHGLRCHAGTCGDQPLSDVGGECRGDDDCTPTTFCAQPQPGANGTCAAKRASGGQCTNNLAGPSECLGRCNAEAGAAGTCASLCGSP